MEGGKSEEDTTEADAARAEEKKAEERPSTAEQEKVKKQIQDISFAANEADLKMIAETLVEYEGWPQNKLNEFKAKWPSQCTTTREEAFAKSIATCTDTFKIELPDAYLLKCKEWYRDHLTLAISQDPNTGAYNVAALNPDEGI